MKFLQRSPAILLAVWLLAGCDQDIFQNKSTNFGVKAQPVGNCPASDEKVRQLDVKGQEDFGRVFDFTAQAITATADTVAIATANYNLVFCRATQTWAILPPDQPAASTEDAPQELLNNGEAPAFQTLQVGQVGYQYRVILAPNPFPNYNYENPPQKVIFELMPPDQKQAIAVDLYSLEELRAEGIGYELGVADVRAALSVGDALFFAVSSEQGEGFSGLSTLIRYEPKTKKLELLQPKEIIGEQITDLVATEEAATTTLWLGTKYSVEGSGLIPAKGLVAYRFPNEDWKKGAIANYDIHNSPLIGAIPTQLYTEKETLWAATGNGICQIQWQKIAQWDAWECWRYTFEIELPIAGLPFYRSRLATAPATTLTPTADRKTTEVLWWSSTVPFGIAPTQERRGRFEISNPTGFKASLPEGGFKWEDTSNAIPRLASDDQVYWSGEEWHWEGDRFARGFDEIAANAVGLGPVGISERGFSTEGVQDTNVLRGDLKLLSLTTDNTELVYFSGWVDDNLISPNFVIKPSQKQPNTAPNPLKAIAPTLKTIE